MVKIIQYSNTSVEFKKVRSSTPENAFVTDVHDVSLSCAPSAALSLEMHACDPLKRHSYNKSASQITACAQPLVLILDGAWVNPTGASVGLLADGGSRTPPRGTC